MLNSESIAGMGIARLISWLGTAGPFDRFNRVTRDQSFSIFLDRNTMQFSWFAASEHY